MEEQENFFQGIYSCSHIGEADIIVSLLKRNGFNPKDLTTSPIPGVTDDDKAYYVYVPKEEYESAKDFLVKEGFVNIL